MAKNIESLAKKLGATVVGAAPEYSPGACGMAMLANTLGERLELEPSSKSQSLQAEYERLR